jgi:ligand-binding SRPBCC domain-containing protein
MGIAQQLTVEVVECDRPNMFIDAMVQGPMTSFRHKSQVYRKRGHDEMADTLTGNLDGANSPIS